MTISTSSLLPSVSNKPLDHLLLENNAKKHGDGKRTHGDFSKPHSVTSRAIHMSCGYANSDVPELLSHRHFQHGMLKTMFTDEMISHLNMSTE